MEEMGVMQPQPLPSQPTVEDVPFQIGLVIVSVMMEIIMKNATMMVVTAVDQMSIQISVMNVCALNEKLADENTISSFLMLKVVSLYIFCTNKLQIRCAFDGGDYRVWYFKKQ